MGALRLRRARVLPRAQGLMQPFKLIRIRSETITYAPSKPATMCAGEKHREKGTP